MKMIIVGASGTMGTYLSKAFEKEHEVVRADRSGTYVQVDITSPAAIGNMYMKVGPFDALICTAGPTYVGPWKTYQIRPFAMV
jgi:dTDP-4-dehydrorhamnose reductase